MAFEPPHVGSYGVVKDLPWHYANRPCPTVPGGGGDEDAIRSVWARAGEGGKKAQ